MRESIRNLNTAGRLVFVHPSYVAWASVCAILVFLFAVWLPNFGLMAKILTTSNAPLADTVKIALGLLGGIRTNFSFLSAGYTIAIAALFGINVAMVAYILRRQRKIPGNKEVATGFGAVASGGLGIGCAACGSFLLSTALSFFGAAGAVALLPLRGGEFGVLSVVLLILSLLFISKKVATPIICKSS